MRWSGGGGMAAVFEALSASPCTADELAAILAERLQVQADAELAGAVGEIVRMLREKCIAAIAGDRRDDAR